MSFLADTSYGANYFIFFIEMHFIELSLHEAQINELVLLWQNQKNNPNAIYLKKYSRF